MLDILRRARRSLALATSLALPVVAGCHSDPGDNGKHDPVAGHPRLLVTEDDLPRLRSWAVPGNPTYEGLKSIAAANTSILDAVLTTPKCTDPQGSRYCEHMAENFAFLSLVSPSPVERDDYAKKAHAILMRIIELASQPTKGDMNNVSDEKYSIAIRASSAGAGVMLTIDWIYPYLTKADKLAIYPVLLRWADELVHATRTSHNHPEPIGVFNDPVLVQDPEATRYAANNFFVAHGRNLALIATCLDPTDDPGQKLHGYLDNATGAFLYMTDYLYRHDGAGGLPPEGSEYGSLSLGLTSEMLYALHTAGLDDPAARGPQVDLRSSPFWMSAMPANVHARVPGLHSLDYAGLYHRAFSWGDSQDYDPASEASYDWAPTFAPVGLIAKDAGDQATYDMARWMVTDFATGGPDHLKKRVGNTYVPRQNLFYFLLLDPAAQAPIDPRPTMPLSYFADGLKLLFSRTSWSEDAAYFSYQFSWTGIDHQHADANTFAFYRKGEWLTKECAGYSLPFSLSPAHNAIAIQNDPPIDKAQGSPAEKSTQVGSQFLTEIAGDGKILARSEDPAYTYVAGDATGRYNSPFYKTMAVSDATRAVFWLKPDHVIVHDRAVTNKNGRFKRFFLQLPADPTISGTRMRATTASGQVLALSSLLPVGALLTKGPVPDNISLAHSEPMTHTLQIAAPNGNAEARFLNVLQGVDAGVEPDAPVPLTSTAGTPFDGAAIGSTAVLFPANHHVPVPMVTFTVPAEVTKIFVTGLSPKSGYNVVQSVLKTGEVSVTVTVGTQMTSDEGGVLAI
ncbi:MAG: hypothetical protein U0359_14200 [Byssovorax sp.]